MIIDLSKIKVGSKDDNSFDRVDAKDLNWGIVDEGTYAVTMAIVYPWREITMDTNVRVRGDDGRFLRDDDGNYVTEVAENLTWHMSDIVFKINGGKFDGHAVKYTLSTHPNWIGTAKQFLYRMKLFGVSLDDLYKHVGATGFAVVKNRDETYTDKDTGLEVTRTVSYVSYIDEADAESNIGI